MIEYLRLENFKRHRATELRLAPFTLLVGPNGSGKTSVLEALSLLSRLDRPEGIAPRRGFSMAATARRAEGVETVRVAVRGSHAAAPRSLELTLARRDHRRWHGSAVVGGGSAVGARSYEPDFDLPIVGPRGYWPELHDAVLLRLDARAIAAASEPTTQGTLGVDGAPFASVLALRKLSDDPTLAKMQDALRTLVPEFRALRIVPTNIGDERHPRTGYCIEIGTDSGTRLSADDVSEGTLVLLALLSVVYSTERPRLLLLDGIDTHLHPTAQLRLTKLLAELVETDKTLQLIATTHSPYVLDVVAPSAVVVFAKGANGEAGARSLAEHPECERMHGRLASGQLWTLDDEQDWVLEAGP